MKIDMVLFEINLECSGRAVYVYIYRPCVLSLHFTGREMRTFARNEANGFVYDFDYPNPKAFNRRYEYHIEFMVVSLEF